MSAPLTPAQCTCIHEPETDAGQVLHASYCVAYTPAPLTPERLAEYAALEQAATKGPWRREDDAPSLTRLVVSDDSTLDVSLGYVGNRTQGDAAFIAAARTAVPELLAEVARLSALVTAMHAAAVGEVKPPLLGLVEDAAATRSAFLAQQARADTLDGIARQHRAERDELETSSRRYRIAWRMARTRALATGGAADRSGARAAELQTAVQDSLAAIIGGQLERDGLQKRIAELEAAAKDAHQRGYQAAIEVMRQEQLPMSVGLLEAQLELDALDAEAGDRS